VLQGTRQASDSLVAAAPPCSSSVDRVAVMAGREAHGVPANVDEAAGAVQGGGAPDYAPDEEPRVEERGLQEERVLAERNSTAERVAPYVDT
jgi:hypothetical protein